MNKIYKIVWSKIRNTWVVASEIAKGHGKSSSSEGNGKLLKSLVLTALRRYVTCCRYFDTGATGCL